MQKLGTEEAISPKEVPINTAPEKTMATLKIKKASRQQPIKRMPHNKRTTTEMASGAPIGAARIARNAIIIVEKGEDFFLIGSSPRY